jgi:hypothetical protein
MMSLNLTNFQVRRDERRSQRAVERARYRAGAKEIDIKSDGGGHALRGRGGYGSTQSGCRRFCLHEPGEFPLIYNIAIY